MLVLGGGAEFGRASRGWRNRSRRRRGPPGGLQPARERPCLRRHARASALVHTPLGGHVGVTSKIAATTRSATPIDVSLAIVRTPAGLRLAATNSAASQLKAS